jgi:hypothetical protein
MSEQLNNKVTKTGAPNTIKGYDTAVNYFNTWRVNNNKVTLFVMTEDDLCQESLFDEYAKHLKEEATLAMQTAQQYFSGLKNVCVRMFGEIDNIWQYDKWYLKLYRDIGDSLMRRSILAGEEASRKVKGAGRNTMDDISTCHWTINTPESYVRNCSLINTSHAIGRMAEVAFTSWRKSYWCHEFDALTADWGQLKNCEEKLMSYFSDHDKWNMDFYLGLFAYFVTGGGCDSVRNDDEAFWIYPKLAALQNPAATINSYMQQLLPSSGNPVTSELLHEDVCGKSLRVGFFNQVSNHKTGGLGPAIARGDWDCRGDSAAMEYHTQVSN